MSKHTKGKWIASTEYTVFGRSYITIHNEEFEYIVDEYGISENNAHIISKTPEMLEMLKKMCAYHEKMATWDKGDNGYYEAKRLIAEIEGQDNE